MIFCQVLVTKMIKPEANVQLEWTSKEIAANAEVSMEIVWSPLIAWSSREILQLTDNRNLKVDVAIILKSVDKSQRTKNVLWSKPSSSRLNSDRIVTKKLTLKSPSPRTKLRLRKAMSSPSNATAARRKDSTQPPKTARNEPAKKVLGSQNPIGGMSQIDMWEISDIRVASNEKENKMPATPKSSLSMIDAIKFTPKTEKKVLNTSNVDFLASLPTPSSNAKVLGTTHTHINLSPSVEYGHRAAPPHRNGFNVTTTIEMTPQTNGINNQTTTLDNFQTPHLTVDQSELLETTNYSQYASQKTPMSCRQRVETTTETLTMEYNYSFRQAVTSVAMPAAAQVGFHGRKLVLDSMFASPAAMRVPPCNETSPTTNRTHIIVSPVPHIQLSVINEEENTRSDLSDTYVKTNSDHQRTYNVVDGNAKTPEDLARDVKLVGVPLRKKFQSMRDLGNENNLSLEQQMLKENQGSMPNLHKLEAVKSIENNRYFCQSIEKDLQTQTDTVEAVALDFSVATGTMDNEHEHENLGDTSICSIKSTMSTQSVAFKEHEILAQSSLYNLNELGKSTKSLAGHAKPVYFCIDKPSEARAAPPKFSSKFSSTPIGQFSVSSPSLNRIGSSHKSLSQSKRDVREPSASASNRPSVISFASTSKSAATTPGKKRNGDDMMNLSKKSLNKHSPPKRACIDRSQSETELTKGQAFRTKTWGGVMPKKFRVPSVPIQKLTLKRQPDERVILFDPDLHMRGE